MKHQAALRATISFIIVVILAPIATLAYDELWWRFPVSPFVVATFCIAGALIFAAIAIYIIWTMPLGNQAYEYSARSDEGSQ